VEGDSCEEIVRQQRQEHVRVLHTKPASCAWAGTLSCSSYMPSAVAVSTACSFGRAAGSSTALRLCSLISPDECDWLIREHHPVLQQHQQQHASIKRGR
jgi:hypothetical protein